MLEALNCLKVFCEEANEYHIISADILLGALLTESKSYPVGKVNLLKIRPLDFDEYLMAADEGLYNYYSKIVKNRLIEEVFHNRLIDAYHNYLIIGGMPESVSSWIEDKDPRKIKQIQSELIELYENDISKHSGKINAGRILLVLRSLSSQLARENNKFSYNVIKQGARAGEFEEAIEWLVSAGLINRVRNVNKIKYPLKACENLDSFKLYFFDTGLLTCLSEVDYASIQFETDYQFKGPLAEKLYFATTNRTI